MDMGGLPECFADHLWGKQEVVVVDNDQISRVVDLSDLLSEERVGTVVGDP